MVFAAKVKLPGEQAGQNFSRSHEARMPCRTRCIAPNTLVISPKQRCRFSTLSVKFRFMPRRNLEEETAAQLEDFLWLMSLLPPARRGP